MREPAAAAHARASSCAAQAAKPSAASQPQLAAKRHIRRKHTMKLEAEHVAAQHTPVVDEEEANHKQQKTSAELH